MTGAPESRLDGLLFGQDRAQRMRAKLSLLALMVYIAFAGVQHAEVMLGMIDETASWRLTAFNLSGGLLFYAIARCRAGLRWMRNETFAVAQQLWAQVAITASYAITGEARGAVLLILLLVTLYSVFALKPRTTALLSASGLTMIATVMAWKAVSDPAAYPPRVEVTHFVFLLVVLAACTALSVQIGRLRQRLQHQVRHIQELATRDELTGLLNRRAILEQVRGADAASPLGGRLGIALLDLDHFKRINDSLGHSCGDEVLRRFAAVAVEAAAPDELVARWGGEEFLLIGPLGGGRAPGAVLDALRHRLGSVCWDDLCPGLQVTFSAGISVCDRREDLGREIVSADRALYEAKAAGRDCVRSSARPNQQEPCDGSGGAPGTGGIRAASGRIAAGITDPDIDASPPLPRRTLRI